MAATKKPAKIATKGGGETLVAADRPTKNKCSHCGEFTTAKNQITVMRITMDAKGKSSNQRMFYIREHYTALTK